MEDLIDLKEMQKMNLPELHKIAKSFEIKNSKP